MNITLEQLAKSPAFSAALHEIEAGQLAERQAQIDALTEFRAQTAAELAPLDAMAEQAAAELEPLRARLAELQAERERALSAANWRRTRATAEERRLEDAILRSADQRLIRFKVWCARAENLTKVATSERYDAYSGATAQRARADRVPHAIQACADAIARAEQMRREAIAADDVALELDALAAGILEAVAAVGGQAVGRLPKDWRQPIV